MTLEECRALLRAAMKDASADVAAYCEALRQANEEQRAALAKTLPPSRLFKSEGPTPRACFVLAALGTPKLIGEQITPIAQIKTDPKHFVTSDLTVRMKAESFTRPTADIIEHLFSGAKDRSEEWLYLLMDHLTESHSWWRSSDITWPLIRRLVHERTLVPDSVTYLARFIERAGPEAIDDFLRSDSAFLTHDFWALFRTEGLGCNWLLCNWNADAWNKALLNLCESEPGFRARLLDESLNALLRDFSAKNITWYHRVHRLLDPTPQEIGARESVYYAVLGAAPRTSVGLAQDMLARMMREGLADVEGFLQASRAVLQRTERKLLKAQLGLLRNLVKAVPSAAAAVSGVVADALGTLPVDLVAPARALISAEAATCSAPTEVSPNIDTTGTAVDVSAPRTNDLPGAWDERPEITTEHDFLDLFVPHLEGGGDGGDIPRLLRFLHLHSFNDAAKALAQRAREVFDNVWDHFGLSPRRHLVSIFLARLGDSSRTVEFAGCRMYGIPTHSPSALLALCLQRTQAAIQGGCDTADVAEPLPAISPAWRRDVLLLRAEAKPFWLHRDPPDVKGTADFAQLALDVADVPAEFNFRAEMVRSQDGFEQIVQWAAWLYRDNPDTLAAHAHPMLWTATHVVNVRGVGPLLNALGIARRPLDGPAYSALALGLSAKMAEHRAQAAEAVAALAGSGLLQPDKLAEQIRAHLADGFVMAGRLAQSLTDTASISPIAGYRVLQTLAELLPALVGITAATKLVECAAHLAASYGTPVPLPPALAPKTKGSSVMAAALRMLAAVQPQRSPLAIAAAEQAERALSAQTEPTHT